MQVLESWSLQKALDLCHRFFLPPVLKELSKENLAHTAQSMRNSSFDKSVGGDRGSVLHIPL